MPRLVVIPDACFARAKLETTTCIAFAGDTNSSPSSLRTMSNVGSVELWAAAKVIARECATVNKEYLLCKKFEGENPTACLKKAELTLACNTNIVDTAKTKFPTEFGAYAKCLDFNDYRYHDCKKEERAFFDCWNKLTK